MQDGPLAGSRGHFVRDDDGAIAWFRFGLRLYAPDDRADQYPWRGGPLTTAT